MKLSKIDTKEEEKKERIMSEEKKQELLSKKKKGIIAGSIVASVVIAGGIVGGVVGGLAQNKGYTLTISSEFENFGEKSLKVDNGTKIKDLRSMITSPVEGYKVGGFYKDTACTEAFNEEDLINENTKVYIRFDIMTFTVRAYADTSKTELLAEKEVAYKTSAELGSQNKAEDKVGRYTFVGWVDAQGNEIDVTSVTQDIEVYPKYDIDYNEYTVTITDRDNNVILTRAGVPIARGETVHYDERLAVVVKESLGYKQTAFNVEGATKDEATGLWKIEGNVTITYNEEYTTHVMGNIPKQVTVKKVENNDIENGTRIAVAKGDELLHGQIVEIYYTTTTDYTVSEFEVSGAYVVSGADNLYGITSDLTIVYTEEWAGEGEEPIPDVEYLNYEAYNDGWVVTGFNYEYLNGEVVEDLIIPAKYQGKKVYGIKDGYFDDNYGPSASNGVFMNNSSIKTVSVMKGVEFIGECAFANCANLLSVNCAEGVKDIGRYAFWMCKKMDSFSIPSTLENIKFYALASTGLTSVTIPEGIKTIEDYAFDSCNSLQYNEYDNKLYLGNSENPYLVLIRTKDKSITSCEINTNTKIIYSSAFSGCSNLTEITLPNSITFIGDYAFSSCSSLIEITLPNSVTSIGNAAFNSCSSLTEITLPNSVISIGNAAFNHCTNLIGITIPNYLISIGYDAFSYCGSLQYNEYDNALYLGNSKNPYLLLVKAKNTNITNCEINTNTKFICSNAFLDCSSLTFITIPNSVTSIGQSAFRNCSSLVEITISDSVTSIENYTFERCNSLTNVIIESVEIYEKAKSKYYAAGNLLEYATTIKVLKTIVDDPNNTNTYLNDETKFAKTEGTGEDSNYYIYNKK